MASILYAVLNPIMKGLLRSPIHGMVSANIAVIEFTGRKSGRQMSTPVTYHIKDGRVHCFTSKDFTWWKNLVGVPEIAMIIKGQRIVGEPRVVVDDVEAKKIALTDILTAVPRDASFSDVRLDENKLPNADDIARVVPNMVYISMASSH